jgi:hypothetical protein
MSLHLPIAILAALSLTSGAVVGLYERPLIGINHAELAHSSPDEARSLMQLDLSEVIAKETVTKFEKLSASIAEDVRGVRGSENLANVTYWRFLPLRGAVESIRGPAIVFMGIHVAPHLAAKATHLRF